MGCSPHVLGGEVRARDPGGNTLLLGQEEWSASQPAPLGDEPSSRFSLLREAAAAVEANGGTTTGRQVGERHGLPCRSRAEMKLADSGGGSVWACITHADEILVKVPGAFVASQATRGSPASGPPPQLTRNSRIRRPGNLVLNCKTGHKARESWPIRRPVRYASPIIRWGCPAGGEPAALVTAGHLLFTHRGQHAQICRGSVCHRAGGRPQLGFRDVSVSIGSTNDRGTAWPLDPGRGQPGQAR